MFCVSSILITFVCYLLIPCVHCYFFVVGKYKSAMSSTTSDLESPRLSDHSSWHNRKTVVVEEKMLKAPKIDLQIPCKSPSTETSPSIDHSLRDSCSGPSKISTDVSHLAEQDDTSIATTVSSPDCIRSSSNSFVGTASNASNVMPLSSKNRILEFLQHQIYQSAMKIYQLEKKVQDIPKLLLEVDKLEKERAKLANNMLDSQELVKTMKQRISVLHEQNEQLAQLTTSAKTESSEVMRIRNTLVASLAQLKQLQKQVDTIPALKGQVRVLANENAQLKEIESKRSKQVSVESCQNIEPSDYQALIEENQLLKQEKAGCAQRLIGLNEQLCTVSTCYDELKLKIDSYSSSVTAIQLLQEQVKQLESEKDNLHHQIVELKLHGSGYVDVDTAYLGTQLSELNKKNSQLRCQLEHQRIESKLLQEQTILQLFELETLKVRNQKYEVEGQMLGISRDNKLDFPESVTHSQEDHSDNDSLPESLPIVKQQLLNLHHLKYYFEQSHHLLQTMVVEKKDLEKRVGDLANEIEKSKVIELEGRLLERETKLKIAFERIHYLEHKLSHSDSHSELITLESENERLTQKLEELQLAQKQSLEVIRDLKEIKEQQKHYDFALRKAKEEKRKAEKRYKDIHDRLQSLANELSSSAELLKNYQTQCAKLQKDIDSTRIENSSIRSEAAILKADLEVARVELSSRSHNSMIEISEVHQLQQSCDKLSEEKEKLQDDIKKSTCEFQEKLKVIEKENVMLSEELMTSGNLLESKVCELQKKTVECETLQINVSKMEILVNSTAESKIEVEVCLEELKKKHDQLLEEVALLHVQLSKVTQQQHVLTNEFTASEEGRKKESLSHLTTRQNLQKSREVINELQKANKTLQQEAQYLRSEDEKLKQALVTKDRELQSERTKSEATSLLLSTEKERLNNLLKKSEAHTEARIDSLTREKSELISKLRHIEELSQVTQLESKLQEVNHELETLHKDRKSERGEMDLLRRRSLMLTGEVEGYKAMVDNLHKRLEEAEAREIEHEQLRSKIKKLERLLGDSSHDNKTLVKLLHETVGELPTYSTEATRSLQDENLKLEEQVSVLSQWNDKQRQEIEDLERQNCHLLQEKHQLLLDLTTKEGHLQENLQLKRELKEVEMEINTLRRQALADVHEELQIKIETQTQLLSVFSQHNDSLQMQVEQLQKQVLHLGGELDKQAPVSPPPMPPISISSVTLPNGEEMKHRTWSDLGRENLILKQRIKTMEDEIRKLNGMSSSVRRRSSTLHALTSVPVGTIHEELQIK